MNPKSTVANPRYRFGGVKLFIFGFTSILLPDDEKALD
jgi:hypothetical protein